jgi:hypothetical protein
MPSKRYSVIEHREVDPSLQNIMQESSTQLYPLGARLALDDGRVFRYCENGGSALAAGLCVANPIPGTEREDTLTAAVAAGARSLTYTAVGTITENQYRDGLLCVVDGTGQGLQYKIESHLAIAAAATGTINLYDPIVTALDTTTDVMLVPSIYKDVVLTPDQIVQVVGVPPIPVTADYFFWAQTWGIAPVLNEDGLGNLATERICNLGTSGGYISTNGMAPGAPVIGIAIFDSLDATNGDYHPIFLQIQP